MLRSSLSLLVAASLVVAGCPVYDDDCVDDSSCGPGYVCHVPTRECVSAQEPQEPLVRCSQPSDCDQGDTCDRFGRCQRETCGSVGCVSGYRCEVMAGLEHCMRDAGSGGGGGNGAEAGATSEAGASQGGAGG